MNKDAVIDLLCLIGMFLAGVIAGITAYDRHDVNRDGKVSAQDYVEIKNYIMEEK